MPKLHFETPASYQEKIESAIYWEAPEDNSDNVERAGYRTIEQQVREMQLAGERLEDWRLAVYPEGTDVFKLDPVPVFGDEMEALRRFKDLQNKRENRNKAYEIERKNQEEIKAKEKLERDAPPPPPQRVVIVSEETKK